MASQAYIRNQSEYLRAGNLSDLTVIFGQSTWQAHKAIACSHSRWFRNAVTSNFEESFSKTVILKDEPEFADAIDCMVSYFYSDGYSASQYNSPAALLHARVAVIADKYDCASLFDLAADSLQSCITTAAIDDWVAIAGLVYSRTTPDLQTHVDLRNTVVGAATGHVSAGDSFLQNKSVEELLRSTADLATDLLLSSAPQIETRDQDGYIFVCENCSFAHAGLCTCPNAVVSELGQKACPQCGTTADAIMWRTVHCIKTFEGVSCSSCHGLRTMEIPPPVLNT